MSKELRKERNAAEQDISTIRKQLNFSNSLASTVKENSSIQNALTNSRAAAPLQAISPFNIIDNQEAKQVKSEENTFSFAHFNLKQEVIPSVLKLEDLENHEPNLPVMNVKQQLKKVELKRISRTPEQIVAKAQNMRV